MKVIFLDIDGVLNNEVFIASFWEICKRMELKRPEANKLRGELIHDEYGQWFCPTAVHQLSWVIETTGAKIVMSSTWRMSGLETVKNMWRDRKLPGDIIDITPIHSKSTLPFMDRLERGGEIKEWLDSHPEVESYVIIDDDRDMLPEQLENFVQTDERYGLTFNDALKCVEILNK